VQFGFRQLIGNESERLMPNSPVCH